MVDEILRKLAKKDSFPNLKAIVVAGHSAGGQFVNRYEMSNKIHETLGVPVKYVDRQPFELRLDRLHAVRSPWQRRLPEL